MQEKPIAATSYISIFIKTIKETDINSYVQIKPSYSFYSVSVKDKTIVSFQQPLSCWGLTEQSPTRYLLWWQLGELQQALLASDWDKVSNVNYLGRGYGFADKLHIEFQYNCKHAVQLLHQEG